MLLYEINIYRDKIFLVICSLFCESKMPSFTKQVNYSLPLPDFHTLYIHTLRCNALSFVCRDNFYFCNLFHTCSRPVKVNKKVRQAIHQKISMDYFFPWNLYLFQYTAIWGWSWKGTLGRWRYSKFHAWYKYCVYVRETETARVSWLSYGSLETPTLCFSKQKVSTIVVKC